MFRPFHHPTHYTPHKRELRHLFWSDGVASLGVAMVQLLVPAYLLLCAADLLRVWLGAR
jgi:hypothetical protein